MFASRSHPAVMHGVRACKGCAPTRRMPTNSLVGCCVQRLDVQARWYHARGNEAEKVDDSQAACRHGDNWAAQQDGHQEDAKNDERWLLPVPAARRVVGAHVRNDGRCTAERGSCAGPPRPGSMVSAVRLEQGSWPSCPSRCRPCGCQPPLWTAASVARRSPSPLWVVAHHVAGPLGLAIAVLDVIIHGGRPCYVCMLRGLQGLERQKKQLADKDPSSCATQNRG